MLRSVTSVLKSVNFVLSSVSNLQSFQINFLSMAPTTTVKKTLCITRRDSAALRKGSLSDGDPLPSPRHLSINMERVDPKQESRPSPLSGDGSAPMSGGGPGSQEAGSANQSADVE